MFKLWGIRELKDRDHGEYPGGVHPQMPIFRKSLRENEAAVQRRKGWRSLLFHYLLDHKNHKEAAALSLALTFENERLRQENHLLRISAEPELLARKFVDVSVVAAKDREILRLERLNRDWSERYDEAFGKTLDAFKPKA